MMTVSDLLGNPLPSSLVNAKSMDEIQVSWRRWLSMRVKIIDEYNRIATKTQSALLSLMAEGYAEMFDQYVYAGRSSWFLTANDDAGGPNWRLLDTNAMIALGKVGRSPTQSSANGRLIKWQSKRRLSIRPPAASTISG